MIKSRLATRTFVAVFLGALFVPAVAFAQEAGAAAAAGTVTWQASVGRSMAAAIAMAVSASAAGYAQSKIGSAAAGTLAERPEAGTFLIVLQALPEIIVLLGFVIAFMIK
jgi:V/A-type H+/Na+-transporting ATPase subunit K